MRQTNHDIVERLLEADDEDDFKEVYGEPVAEKYLPLGSISHGTMRVEDLVPVFLDFLKTVDPAKAAELAAEYAALPDPDDPDFCWETLFQELESHAPPYTYFGSHPGDGSDYGVWLSIESIDDDLRYENGDLRAIRVGEPVIPGEGYVVVVDNAGEYIALLNGRTGKQVWNVS